MITSLRPSGGPATVRSEQALPITFNQGVAWVGDGWVLSGTNSPVPGTDVLVRTDPQLHIVAQQAPAIPPELRARNYDHVGDIDVIGSSIYAPLEQPNYDKGEQVTARFDVRTLRYLGSVTLPQHENSFVAVDPRTTPLGSSCVGTPVRTSNSSTLFVSH